MGGVHARYVYGFFRVHASSKLGCMKCLTRRKIHGMSVIELVMAVENIASPAVMLRLGTKADDINTGALITRI